MQDYYTDADKIFLYTKEAENFNILKDSLKYRYISFDKNHLYYDNEKIDINIYQKNQYCINKAFVIGNWLYFTFDIIGGPLEGDSIFARYNLVYKNSETLMLNGFDNTSLNFAYTDNRIFIPQKNGIILVDENFNILNKI